MYPYGCLRLCSFLGFVAQRLVGATLSESSFYLFVDGAPAISKAFQSLVSHPYPVLMWSMVRWLIELPTWILLAILMSIPCTRFGWQSRYRMPIPPTEGMQQDRMDDSNSRSMSLQEDSFIVGSNVRLSVSNPTILGPTFWHRCVSSLLSRTQESPLQKLITVHWTC